MPCDDRGLSLICCSGFSHRGLGRGIHVLGSGKHGGLSLRTCDGCGSGSRVSPGDLVVVGAATGGVLGTLVATGRLSGKDMPVVEAVVNGRTCLCLVDTGSGSTMVSTRVVVGLKGRKARTVVTADGKTSSGREIPVTVGLQGHTLNVSAIALPGLENLGVDCLLGDDVIDLMKGVTVK